MLQKFLSRGAQFHSAAKGKKKKKCFYSILTLYSSLTFFVSCLSFTISESQIPRGYRRWALQGRRSHET